MSADNKINVVVVGNSGSGKSTLINAVMDNKTAKTSIGERGTIDMAIYENDTVPFRLIDTRGVEYSWKQNIKMNKQLKKWATDALNNADYKTAINMIWYCVDGTGKRVMKENLEVLNKVTKFFPKVPVIVVITKSISELDHEENINMVKAQVAKYQKNINLKDIIPVLAEEYPISDTIVMPSYGLDELINSTCFHTPEAVEKCEINMTAFADNIIGRGLDAYITTNAVIATGIGAIKIPVPDAPALMLLQSNMIVHILKKHKVDIDVGTLAKIISSEVSVSAFGKTVVGTFAKLIPGGTVVNAVTAGTVTFLVGSATRNMLDMAKKGDFDMNDTDKVKSYFKDFIDNGMSNITNIVKDLKIDKDDLASVKSYVKQICSIFSKKE